MGLTTLTSTYKEKDGGANYRAKPFGRFEGFPTIVLVMEDFHPVFCNFCMLISFIPQFLQLINLKLSKLPHLIHVKVHSYNSPVCLMFKFNWQAANLSINKPIRRHA